MSPYSVLVVDDHALLRQLLAAALAADDRFTVAGHAADGHEAIGQARRLQPDAVILDVQMPCLNGLDALPALRAASPGAVVVMHSSDPGADVAALACQRGAAAYVVKGEPVRVLLDRLAELCARAPATAS